MATFGYTSVGASTADEYTGAKAGVKYTLSENTSDMTQISLYTVTNAVDGKVVVYTDNAGVPNTLIASNTTGTTCQTNNWTTFSITTGAQNAGDYWVFYKFSGTQQVKYDSGGEKRWNAENYADAFSNPCGATNYAGDQLVSLYVTYTSGIQLFTLINMMGY